MEEKKKSFGAGVIVGLLGAAALAVLAGLTIVYSGAYNVAATEEHLSLTRWAFDTTLHRSVRQRAEDFQRAEAVTPQMLAAGAEKYKAMCQHCHGGPGAKRESWAEGMRPRPPYLAEAAAEWQPGEIFWIVKHGIKMTGMPAFGPSHDDQTLRSIAAFVKDLPAMTPERYQSLGGSGTSSQGHGHRSGGQHGGSGGQQGSEGSPGSKGNAPGGQGAPNSGSSTR